MIFKLRSQQIHLARFIALSLVLIAFLPFSASSQQTERHVDDPEDQEDLNRELWEFARQTPYESILPYIAAAQRASQAKQTNEIELPNGWRIAPAGTQVAVGRLPFAAILFAGKLVVLDTGYYYPRDRESQEVSIVDVTTSQVVKTLRIRSLFPSAVVGMDGKLYISGGYDQKVYRINQNFEIDREYPVNGFAGGLAFIDQTRLAVGYLATKNALGNYADGKLAVVNTRSGEIEREAGIGFFPYAVRFVNRKIFVTLAGEHRLLIFDSGLQLKKSLDVGRSPLEMCGDNRRLYVVNTGSDSLSVIDPNADKVVQEINLATRGSRFGGAPTSCTVDGGHIYVSLGERNAVAVLNRSNPRRQVMIPTGWYPTKVLTDRDHLLVVNAKGIRGRRPNPNGPQPTSGNRVGDYVLTLLQGSVSVINKKEIAANEGKWSQQVESAVPLFQSGNSPPIKHVFYIVKENRTYDQVLGDLERGNGDPRLTLFGEDTTPVQHQLARAFVTLDNFFVNGEVSVLGHAYTTAGYAGPFSQWMANVEYSTRWKGGGYASSPAVEAPAYIWDRLIEKKIDYRFYGEDYFLFNRSYRIIAETFGPQSALAKKFYEKSLLGEDKRERGQQFFDLAKSFYERSATREQIGRLLDRPEFATPLSRILVGDESLAVALKQNVAFREKVAECLDHYSFNYPTWDLRASDLERARAWQVDFDRQLQTGRVPQMQYIWLPNDHTDGNGKQILESPFQFVAQNDAALGFVVSTISHSAIWKDSLVLVVEDDAQNGPDHVDATRTIAFAAGPFVKRDAVVSDRYDQLSLLRTIEIMLGLEPINLGDRVAAPMFGIFTDKPDFTPFTVAKISNRLADADRRRYEELVKSAK